MKDIAPAHPVEEVANVDIQCFSNSVQAPRGNAIDPVLVLVRLLKGDPDYFSQLLVGETEHDPPFTYAPADVAIDVLRKTPHCQSMPIAVCVGFGHFGIELPDHGRLPLGTHQPLKVGPPYQPLHPPTHHALVRLPLEASKKESPAGAGHGEGRGLWLALQLVKRSGAGLA